MPRPRLGEALHSTVARRMAALFVVCALLPLAGLAFLTTRRTSAELEAQARQNLHRDVKSVAMDGLAQLELEVRTLRGLATVLASGPEGAAWAKAHLSQFFSKVPEAISFASASAPAVRLVGDLTWPALSAAQRGHLERNGALIVSVGPRRVMLARVEMAGTSLVVGAVLDIRALFALGDDRLLPPASEVCVFEQAAVLACSPDAQADVVRQASAAPANTEMLTNTPEPHMVRAWALMLQGEYGAEQPWMLAMMRPRSAAREPLRPFVRDFWMVAVLAGLIVSWVGLSQVRRELRPLDALMSATRRLSRRDFSQAVDIRSGDEFQKLGQSFNELAADLKRQFDELEAFNFGTLAALARAIDAKSPWTGGHSERVTKIAVAIAEERGLERNHVKDLQRGGLVHDIGKLATPPGILDKPGRLTPEETTIMRAHARQGVHILEPIPAFKQLLPIVGQHHEWWDGSGYPDGLSGEAIAVTARVLAVADVCDALHSDRLYRPGLPVDQVVNMIVSASGTQFEPASVEAFLRVVERGGLDIYDKSDREGEFTREAADRLASRSA